jgi:putative redox protein
MCQEQKPVRTIIKRNIIISYKIEGTIKQRLLIIAGKCLVSKILENNITIDTKI